MYEAFDRFLAVDTWHTMHDLDDQKFYKCLGEVVTLPDFNPEEMGNYFREKVGNGFDAAISRRVTQAWAVLNFFASNPDRL